MYTLKKIQSAKRWKAKKKQKTKDNVKLYADIY